MRLFVVRLKFDGNFELSDRFGVLIFFLVRFADRFSKDWAVLTRFRRL